MRSLYLNDAACFSSSLITMRPLRFLSSPSLYQLVKPTPSLLSPLTSSPHCLSYPYQDHQCLLNIFPGKEMVPAFVLALISLLGACQSSSLASDGWVLASLKHSFQPADQLLLWSWDTSNLTTVCSWAGVRCMDERVVTLDISGLNLSGTISPLLAKLDRLRVLNISNNQFNGGLDLDFPSLVNLEVLDAYNNNLTAPLPLGIVACLKKLKYLDLGGNYFYGTIPSKYGSIITLEFMGLEGNDLTGRVPKELGNLTNLKQLALGHYNAFEGGIPAELGSLVSLVHLDLSECQLEGQIPPELGRLAELDTLYLYGNRLTGQIPKELGNLTNLAFMDLSINALTGQIPPEFVKFKGLRLFNLFMNRLHGSVPRFIADLPSLETLGLWMNNFTGVIPQSLGRYQKLQNLDLSSNKLTGTIPPNLCSSKQLEILILFNNFLFGPIPDSLGSCLTLVKVRMGQNYLNGSIPNTFLYLPDLHLMELHNNYLSGTLWENNRSVFSPTKIARLNLSNNQLTGPLPASFSNFTSLQILLLSDNQLTGLIPPELGELRQVLKMDLSRNSLSQSIPAEIGNCTELTYLDLSQNNLSGPIPTQISQIRILNYLNLSHNQLNQAIPRSIGAMKSLTVADFSFNDLSGKLPDNGQFAYFKASFFAGNPRLCGQVLNNPCNLTAIGTEPKRVPGDLKLVLALGLLISSLVFAGIAIAKSKSLKRSKSDSDSWRMTAFQKVDFAVADVLCCLTDSNVIGKGGAGVVYLGKLPDGEEVAVKKLPVFESHSHDHGFKAEIQTLGNIKHRNIVRLLAFCSNSQMNLLVYEYMRNGSLGEALHGKKGGLLGWDIRYKVALEAARGLCYLHHDCSPMIVHRDVKSNNILLNSNFEAHVADFGLAKFLRDGTTTEPMSAIAGSYGYIAPEYAYTLKVDEKSDVYSFGVVLLELLTGRRPVGEFGEGVDIVQWARRMTNGRCDRAVQILDPRLTVVPKDDAVHMFFVAMLCVQERSVERPTMREVVQMLSEFPRQQLSPTSSKSLPV